jgi:hypothetical protein
MSIQARMQQKLEQIGLPYKQIEVYGRQIVVTSTCRATADKWASLIGKFATFRGVTESIDYCKEQKGTCLLPTTTKVWRTFGAIK